LSIRGARTPREVSQRPGDASGLAGVPAARPVISADTVDKAAASLEAARAAIALGRLDEAARYLDECRSYEPRRHWTAFELARVRLLANHPEQTWPLLKEFLDTQHETLDAEHLATCERLLDREFDRAHDAVLPLYRRLVTLGSRRHRSAILALESALLAGELSACTELLNLLGKIEAPWEHRILARYFIGVKDTERAVRHSLAAGKARPDYFPNVAEVVENLRRLGRLADAESFLLEARPRLAPADRALLNLMTDPTEVNADLAAACASTYADPETLLKVLSNVAEHMPAEQRNAIYARLEERFPRNLALLTGLGRLEAKLRNPAAALQWIRQAQQCTDQPAEQRALRWEEFTIACVTGNNDQASGILAALDPDTLTPSQMLFVGRFFAEVAEWTRALSFIDRALAGLPAIDEAAVSLVARVGRRSRGQVTLLRSLAARTPPLTPSMLRAATALYEDWVTTDGLHDPEAPGIARTLGLAPTALMEFKLSVMAPERAAILGLSGSTAALRRAVFYCADGAYILPALVSLASLLHSNRGFDGAKIFVTVADDVAAATSAVLDVLARHFGVSLGVVLSSELEHEGARMRTSFGAFTGGQFLSEAAYYRIYMARKLARTGEYDQLLYIDSDSVISHGFDDILTLAVSESALLMARVDADLPGVRLATRRFGLPEGLYFNSGLLWFPRVNQRLVELLQETTRVAVERNSELMFLDQCALNIAFAGAFEPLPARFNFFAGPDRLEEFRKVPAVEACMIHVLNRLKPWDSAYPTESPIQRRWLTELQALRRIVGSSRIRPFLELPGCPGGAQ